MDIQAALQDALDRFLGWVEAFIEALPNILAAIIVVCLFWLIARTLRKLVRRGLLRMVSHEKVVELLASTVYLVVLGIGTVIALQILELDKAVTSILAGVGVVGLALGFAFQDIAANFVSGILLSIRRPFREGDIIESNGFMGTVRDVTIRSTELRTFQGQLVIIPNREVFQNPITNYSRFLSRRVDLECGVAYGDDLEQARKVALEAITNLASRDVDKEVELFYESFGDSSINFVVRYWIRFERQTDFLHARSEGIIALKKALDGAGLTIPFPIRTLDFGVVGGEKLAEAIPASWFGGPSASEKEEDAT